MFKNIKKILKILDKDRRKKFNILVLLMIVAMIFETIGIGSLLPLISYFTNENLLISEIQILNFTTKFKVLENMNSLNLILFFIVVIYFFKNIYLVFYGWLESKFAYDVRFNLGVRLFQKYLNNNYMFHIQNNSSVLMHKIMNETSYYGNAIISLSALITESLILLGIIFFLFILKPFETSLVLIIGFILSLIFYLGIKNMTTKIGKKREIAQKLTMKSLMQGLGAVKDIIINNTQNNFVKIFNDNSVNSSKATYKIHFLQRLPRVWFELTTILIIVIVIFSLASKSIETNSIIATIGIFLVASLRIIPSINRILNALQSIRFSEPAINNISKDLEDNLSLRNKKKNLNNKNLEFKSEITFKNIKFSYPNTEQAVLDNLNFTIKKNQFVGIIGETGAGKSTLVDIFMGLLKPESGKIFLDGKNIYENIKSWKRKLGYVPQNLYLIDDTIKKNIAFGLNENDISEKKIFQSIEKSQLKKFINNLENGIISVVGERGIKISGGERQRIGIARALYNDPEIIVFDEATSALDIETERKLLDTLLELKKTKTIIFITHRTGNLSVFDQVYKLDKNKIIKHP